MNDDPDSLANCIARLSARLDAAGAAYTLHAHAGNIASAQDGAQAGFGSLEQMAPTFILKTEKGWLAAVARGDTRLSYKKIKQALGLKDVSLAAPEQVKQLTGAEPGWVSLVNPGLETILDERLLHVDTIYGGTGVPNHTLQINPHDLAHLTAARVFDFTEFK